MEGETVDLLVLIEPISSYEKGVIMSFYEFLWNSPLKHLVLGRDELHLWRATLALPLSGVQLLEQTLAADGRTRAEHFFSPNAVALVLADQVPSYGELKRSAYTPLARRTICRL
jgi:hypothetical protein